MGKRILIEEDRIITHTTEEGKPGVKAAVVLLKDAPDAMKKAHAAVWKALGGGQVEAAHKHVADDRLEKAKALQTVAKAAVEKRLRDRAEQRKINTEKLAK